MKTVSRSSGVSVVIAPRDLRVLCPEHWWTKPSIAFNNFHQCLSHPLQEIIFYKLIDYILHGKEDIKVIPWVKRLQTESEEFGQWLFNVTKRLTSRVGKQINWLTEPDIIYTKWRLIRGWNDNDNTRCNEAWSYLIFFLRVNKQISVL